MRYRNLLGLFACFMASPVARAADPIPADLSVVPSDSVAFVHVRVRDLWGSDLMRGLRETVEKAGPKAVGAFDTQFYPAPSSVDRFTMVVLPPTMGAREPGFLYVMTFTKPVDGAKLKQLYFPGKATMVAGKEIMTDEHHELSGYLADDKTVVLGQGQDIAASLTRKPGSSNKLATSLSLAAGGKSALVVAANPAMVPDFERMIADAPKEFQALLKMDSISLTLTVTGDSLQMGLNANYGNDENAVEAERGLKALAAMGRQQLARARSEMETRLFEQPMNKLNVRSWDKLPENAGMLVGIGAMNQLDEMLDKLPIKKTGSELVADVKVPKEVAGFVGIYSAGLGMMLPAIQKVREASARVKGSNNLKQIGLAMHNFHDTWGNLPSATPKISENPPKEFNKRLSWRVAILPYIEQDNLFKQFKLDEPWDSEHNKKLIPLMPQVYADPRAAAPQGKTYYKVFTGKEAMFNLVDRGTRFVEVTDGLSNTIMVIGGGEPVEWTKPDDIEFDPKKDLPDLGKPFGGIVTVLLGDGSVRTLDLNKIKKETLKALVTKAGGEVVNPDE